MIELKGKLLWYPLLSCVGTIALLYGIGVLFNSVDLKVIHWNMIHKSEENAFSFEVSFIPLLIGVIVGMIVEYTLKKKQT